VEHLADLDAATEQLVAGGHDVRDDQVQALGGAGRRRGDVLAEDDRASGARRRELDHTKVVTGGEVGVEPPTQAAVKTLGAIDVRNRDDDDLELYVGPPRFRGLGCRFAVLLSTAHVWFLWFGCLTEILERHEISWPA